MITWIKDFVARWQQRRRIAKWTRGKPLVRFIKGQ